MSTHKFVIEAGVDGMDKTAVFYLVDSIIKSGILNSGANAENLPGFSLNLEMPADNNDVTNN